MHTTIRRPLAALAAVLLAAPVAAQQGNNTGNPLDPQPNGPRERDPAHHFLLGPTVHVAPGQTIDSAIVEIRDGRIVAVTDMATVRFAAPPGALVHDLAGRHVYAGFIDAHLPIDAPRPDLSAPGVHWNASVTPQRSALDGEGVSDKDAEKLRKLGFTAAAAAPDGGIFAGRSAVVSLAATPSDPADGKPPVYRDGPYQTLSFNSSGSNRGEFDRYPNSQMGAIALIRQTLIDADWHAANRADAPSALDHLDASRGTPLLFRTRDELEGLRGAKIAAEFNRPVMVLGTGTEFRRLDAVAASGSEGAAPVYILPLTIPEKPELDTVGKSDSTDLRTLMTWEQAPTNARRLDDAGVTVCLTADGLRRGEKFHSNLHEAIQTGGLAPERALAMLTVNPAQTLGVDRDLGTVEAGKVASLIVASGDIFDVENDDAEILDVWIDGRRHQINGPKPPFDGDWQMAIAGSDMAMRIVIDGKSVKTIEGEADDANEAKGRGVRMTRNTVSFLIDDTDEGTGTYVVSGVLGPDGAIRGTGLGPDSVPFQWTATRTPGAVDAEPEAQAAATDADAESAETDDLPPADLPGYPFGAYAIAELPPQEAVIFRNATIWTSGPEGVIENGYIVVKDGGIEAVGAGPGPSTEGPWREIDASGKHITPGLLDAHSHTGISRGVNESGQSVTAEVRIQDVTDPDSMNWYRQLAGGVTTVNSMHGSANPIGGQTQTNKVRWGAVHPDDMHMQGAKPGIKFALGENVKQSNWNSSGTRYPQTRMGVETLIRDRFFAAGEYAQANDARRDLELEALAEILAGDRLIHCHSYRQDEILMLCRVAEEFGFTIGTFQHGLEVYKVAEAVKDAAIGASLFSDWWAYKVEVQDAIAQAGPLQTEVGVLTSYNSDSDELSRRMHVEAAKAYKYSGGRLSKEDALKFVTINPAIQLGIEDSVGSIEPGKDADLAIWSGEPLSSFSMCEATWIDGREYFSLERDAELREQNAAHRKRITQKILTDGAPKPKGDGDGEDAESEPETDDRTDEDPPRSLRQRLADQARAVHYYNLYLRGINPADHRCGDCGATAMKYGDNR